jgi:hypothetical protein
MVDGAPRRLAGAYVLFQLARPDRQWQDNSTTDQDGRYWAQVPRSHVFVAAEGAEGMEQPCVATAAIETDTVIPEVELVLPGRAARPHSAASPLITGVVYGATPDGRRPLRSVTVVLFTPLLASDYPVAHVTTDDAGRFFLCRVNTSVQMVVDARSSRYGTWERAIPGTSDMFLEIELTR